MKSLLRGGLVQPLLLSLVLLGAGASAAPEKATATRPAPAGTAAGRSPDAIYRTTCGYCHGHNVGPVIRGRGLEPEVIRHFVRNGQGAMPAFRPTEITSAALAALADWIHASPADRKEHGQ